MEQRIFKGRPQASLSFLDKANGVVKTDSWQELEAGLWSSFLFDNYLYNNDIGEVEQWKWRPLFPNIKVINPGFRWNKSLGEIVPDVYKPQRCEATFETFLESAEKYFKQFEGKKNRGAFKRWSRFKFDNMSSPTFQHTVRGNRAMFISF